MPEMRCTIAVTNADAEKILGGLANFGDDLGHMLKLSIECNLKANIAIMELTCFSGQKLTCHEKVYCNAYFW